jgi:3'-phosphoadenosine 5'-phosphosulfate sulfotransferase (PAPS reductase)/FAD synthetase
MKTLSLVPNRSINMPSSVYRDIKKSLEQLYLQDERPWLAGFSGGKDSTMLASLVFDTVLSIPVARPSEYPER